MFNMILCRDEQRSRVFLTTFMAVALWCAATTLAEAQGGAPQVPPGARAQQSATVLSEAPVYLLPDATRKPLRTLPAGTSLTVLQVRDDWVQVTFNDAQFGRRTGWVEVKLVRLSTAQAPDTEARPPAPPLSGTKPQQTSAPVPRGPVGVRGFGTVGFDKMSASESFEAITGSSTVVPFGGGVQVTNLWQGLFIEGALEWVSRDGERVFIGPDDEVIPLGIALEIKMRTVDIIGGWRSPTVARITSYGGGGVSFLNYQEESEFAEPDENISENFTGFVLMGGVEYAASQWIHVRGELRYRRFGDAIGVGGVSEAFDESTLGGFGVALKVAVGR